VTNSGSVSATNSFSANNSDSATNCGWRSGLTAVASRRCIFFAQRTGPGEKIPASGMIT
jgi:hypothetical protein